MNAPTSASFDLVLTGDDGTASIDLAPIEVRATCAKSWRLMTAATAFDAAGRSLPGDALRVAAVGIVPDKGPAPTNGVAYPVAVAAGGPAVAIASVVDGKGTFDVSARLELRVPAETYAGSYRATLTIMADEGE